MRPYKSAQAIPLNTDTGKTSDYTPVTREVCGIDVEYHVTTNDLENWYNSLIDTGNPLGPDFDWVKFYDELNEELDNE